MTADPPKDIVVIGAGIVGMACASFIQRDGHRVTVLDPRGPGEGASFGNAGCLNGSSVVPMSMPGMLRQVPRWLLEPSLSRDYVRGRMIGENGHVGDPHRLVNRLAEALVRNGGTVLRERALGFEAAAGRVTGVRGESGSHAADHVVVAAGAWSRSLA